jgi:hypothetical protein
LSGEFGGQFTTAFTGFETGIQNAIDGGWYGSDDGYVEGLFPGTIIGGPDSPFTSIGTLAEISNALQAGDSEQAFSYVDTYFLELLDHTLKPLLSPLLDETSKSVTTLSIPVELSQLQTNLRYLQRAQSLRRRDAVSVPRCRFRLIPGHRQHPDRPGRWGLHPGADGSAKPAVRRHR